jgi:hypothetical protein
MYKPTTLEILLGLGALVGLVIILKLRYDEVNKNRPDNH